MSKTQIKQHTQECKEASPFPAGEIRKDIGKEAETEETKMKGIGKMIGTLSSPLLKRKKDLAADSKAWHKHVDASKRDAENHRGIIPLLIVIQKQLSDYMRHYVWVLKYQ